MSVSVSKLITELIGKTKDLLNQELYFIKSCYKYPDKYSLLSSIIDTELQLIMEDYNKIIVNGACMKYYTDGTKKKVKLSKISLDNKLSDVNITNNYITEDEWDKLEW